MWYQTYLHVIVLCKILLQVLGWKMQFLYTPLEQYLIRLKQCLNVLEPKYWWIVNKVLKLGDRTPRIGHDLNEHNDNNNNSSKSMKVLSISVCLIIQWRVRYRSRTIKHFYFYFINVKFRKKLNALPMSCDTIQRQLSLKCILSGILTVD